MPLRHCLPYHHPPEVNCLPCFENDDLPCRVKSGTLLFRVNPGSRNRVNSLLQEVGGKASGPSTSGLSGKSLFRSTFPLFRSPFPNFLSSEALFRIFRTAESLFRSPLCDPSGGVRPFQQKSACITSLTLGPNVVQIWSRNVRISERTKPSKSTEW